MGKVLLFNPARRARRSRHAGRLAPPSCGELVIFPGIRIEHHGTGPHDVDLGARLRNTAGRLVSNLEDSTTITTRRY